MLRMYALIFRNLPCPRKFLATPVLSITVFWIHEYSIQFYICIDLTMLLYTFLVIFFYWYKEWTICLISSNKFFGLLPAFICAIAIGNLLSICLGLNMLRWKWWEAFSEKLIPLIFIKNILLSKALRTISLFPKSI